MRNSKTDVESDDSTLLQYEALRLLAIDRQATFSERNLGLTLFIRRGMLAWIKVCHRCIPANPNPKKRPKMHIFAHEATSEMIKVMANITLSNLEEAL